MKSALTFTVLTLASLIAVTAVAQTTGEPTAPGAPPAMHPATKLTVENKSREHRKQHHADPHRAEQMAGLSKVPPLDHLPAFNVLADGIVTPFGKFAKKGNWLLIYRPYRCPSCDDVMNALAKSTDPRFKEGTSYVIVVAGTSRGFEADVQSKYPQMKSAIWLMDPTLEGEKALKIKVAPMLFGMRGSEIAWRVPGGLGSPEHVEGVASSWLNQEQRSTVGTPVATGQIP